MGKKYYCEYCDKRFKDDLGIRRRHIEGVQHQMAKKEHFAKYKSKQFASNFTLTVVINSDFFF